MHRKHLTSFSLARCGSKMSTRKDQESLSHIEFNESSSSYLLWNTMSSYIYIYYIYNILFIVLYIIIIYIYCLILYILYHFIYICIYYVYYDVYILYIHTYSWCNDEALLLSLLLSLIYLESDFLDLLSQRFAAALCSYWLIHHGKIWKGNYCWNCLWPWQITDLTDLILFRLQIPLFKRNLRCQFFWTQCIWRFHKKPLVN